MKGSGSPLVARRRTILLVLFSACVVLGAAFLLKLQTGPMPGPAAPVTPKISARTPPPAHAKAEKPKVEPLPGAPPPDTAPAPGRTTTVTDADLDYIAARNLLIPVANVTASQLNDTFIQARSEGRQHISLRPK